MFFLNQIRKLFLKIQVKAAGKLLNSQHNWYALDKLKIAGFGTYLVRFMFPIYQPNESLWGYGKPSNLKILKFIEEAIDEYIQLIPIMQRFSLEIVKWNQDIDPKYPEKPHLKNQFFPIADTVTLYSIIRHFKPKKYLEIGSGISTKIAYQAREDGGFKMEITSIDPQPRDFIDNICDSIIRDKLENINISVFCELEKGDVFFFDGSHYCFPGNDVTRFFLDILPNLKVGVIIHLHDIYLPDDYPSNMLKFMWSEQYLLGTWLLGGGQGIKILFPSAYMSKHSEIRSLFDNTIAQIDDQEISKSSWHRQGTSFWMVKS